MTGPERRMSEVGRAREYLRRHEQERRARRQRVALTLAPVAAFVLMFWRA